MAVTKIRPAQSNDLFNRGAGTQVTNNGDTYITGSNISIANIKAGSTVRWRFVITKTAAGTAAPAWVIRVGTAGTTSDTSRCTFTGVAQTGVIDTAIVEIEAVFRTVGSGSSAVLVGDFRLTHGLLTTGFANQIVTVLSSTSAGFDSTVANSVVGISVNSGASSAWTFIKVNVEIINTN